MYSFILWRMNGPPHPEMQRSVAKLINVTSETWWTGSGWTCSTKLMLHMAREKTSKRIEPLPHFKCIPSLYSIKCNTKSISNKWVQLWWGERPSHAPRHSFRLPWPTTPSSTAATLSGALHPARICNVAVALGQHHRCRGRHGGRRRKGAAVGGDPGRLREGELLVPVDDAVDLWRERKSTISWFFGNKYNFEIVLQYVTYLRMYQSCFHQASGFKTWYIKSL